MVGDSAYDTLEWHDPCGQQVVVPVAPYNPRNTVNPKDIEYRVEDLIEEYSEAVQLKQSTLDETYNRRTGVERTNESVKEWPGAKTRPRPRPRTGAGVPSRYAFASSLQSPTTNAETIQEARSSECDKSSMTLFYEVNL
ncbi:hypothetical protein JCM31271_34780 [Halorubrum trueperi]